MTISTLPTLPRTHNGVDETYIHNLLTSLEYIFNLLNKEPVKNNIIYSPSAGDVLTFDGQTWRNVPQGVSVRVNEDITLTPRTSNKYNVYNTDLTADRTVTLSTTNAVDGYTFRISRKAGGNYELSVGTGPLYYLRSGTWCDVTYSSTLGAYYISATGSVPIYKTVSPSVGTITVKGYGPTINGNIGIQIDVNVVNITGYAPTLAIA